MIDAAVATFGRIDILFNNAGITSSRTMQDSSHDEWHRVIDVNIKGTFLCTKAVVPVMKAQAGGTIINMGSILSQAGMASRSAYAASKAAHREFHQVDGARAGSVRHHGERARADGDRHRPQPRAGEDAAAPVRLGVKRTALGRLGQPEDIAGALVFLASPAARFITGQTLYVDGGYSAG